jgi:hypothetical protein
MVRLWLIFLFFVILLSTPNAAIEGYGFYKTIEKDSDKTDDIKGSVSIYLIFFVAALIEVEFVYLLRAIA